MKMFRNFSVFLVTFLFAESATAIQPDIVIDAHSTPAAVELAGAGWIDDTTTATAFRGNAKVTTDSTASASRFARFHTALPETGIWQVYVWNNGRSGFGDAVNVKVTHADLNPTTAILNQS